MSLQERSPPYPATFSSSFYKMPSSLNPRFGVWFRTFCCFVTPFLIAQAELHCTVAENDLDLTSRLRLLSFASTPALLYLEHQDFNSSVLFCELIQSS